MYWQICIMFICSLCTRILKLSNDSSIPPIVAPSRLKNKSNNKRKPKAYVDNSMTKVRSIKKLRWPNWEHQHIVSLVQAKKHEHNASLGVVDSKDCFKNTHVKWKKIGTLMMGCGHNAHVRLGKHARRNGQHYIVITNEFGTTWSGWDIMKSYWICLYCK
jgi:hypothetical protein